MLRSYEKRVVGLAMRFAGCAVALVFVALASAALMQTTTAAGAKKGTVQVAFRRGEQLARASRSGTSPSDAVRALLGGPTTAERSRGLRTYYTPGMRLRRLSVAGRLATVDFNSAFASGSGDRRAARVAQLLRTLTGLHG